jgi:hypothetical protein
MELLHHSVMLKIATSGIDRAFHVSLLQLLFKFKSSAHHTKYLILATTDYYIIHEV